MVHLRSLPPAKLRSFPWQHLWHLTSITFRLALPTGLSLLHHLASPLIIDTAHTITTIGMDTTVTGIIDAVLVVIW